MPEPVRDDLLRYVLPMPDPTGGIIGEPLTDNHFTELFRGPRLATEIMLAVEAAGCPLTRLVRDRRQGDVLVADLTRRFRAWAAATGVDLPAATAPDDDIVTGVLHEWIIPGAPDDLALACSPHRIAAFTAYLVHAWRPAEHARALAVLEPWARFCLDRRGITGEAADQVLAWARRAADDPAQVGSDLVNGLNRPVDETTMTGTTGTGHPR